MGYNFQNGVSALLRLSREECDALEADLSDLRSAQRAARISLDGLGDANDEVARHRRHKLLGMLATFEQAEVEANEKLNAAVVEAKKLSTLTSDIEPVFMPMTRRKQSA
ncbi:hypothetical protein [Hyphococcus lacteus]|uniref:Uncharacterized protein n=1 Tax=Hyphococcus lacteus TaxID=3143536 RepID=A0ABV3Z839_9PROT